MYAYIALCHYLKLKEGKGWRKRDVNILLTRFIRIRVGEQGNFLNPHRASVSWAMPS